MSNRAIRNSKLNFEPLNGDKSAFHAPLNEVLSKDTDMTVWTFLQEAGHANIKIDGMDAWDYRNHVGSLVQMNHLNNLHSVTSHIVSFIFHEILDRAIQKDSRPQKIHDHLIIMRNERAKNADSVVGLSTTSPAYSQDLQDSYNAIMDILQEIRQEVLTSFTKPNANLISPNFYNIVYGNTTDDALKAYIEDIPRYFFNIYIQYLVPHVGFQASSYYNQTVKVDFQNLTNLTDAEMENMVNLIKEKNPRLHLEIASLHEFALANPQVATLGQSWTSRYRSDWCFFKQPLDQVSKKNTFACGLMSDLFGKHTPSFAGLKSHWETLMSKIVADVRKAIPILEKAQQKEAENEAKTEANIREAITAKINDMLTNGDADEEADALTLVSTLAGITSHSLNNRYGVEYYDYNYGQKHTTWIHWNTLVAVEIEMDKITLTDAQQDIIATRYNQRRKELIESHSHRCAHLARQIATETTRHDEAMKSMQEAYIAFAHSV